MPIQRASPLQRFRDVILGTFAVTFDQLPAASSESEKLAAKITCGLVLWPGRARYQAAQIATAPMRQGAHRRRSRVTLRRCKGGTVLSPRPVQRDLQLHSGPGHPGTPYRTPPSRRPPPRTLPPLHRPLTTTPQDGIIHDPARAWQGKRTRSFGVSRHRGTGRSNSELPFLSPFLSPFLRRHKGVQRQHSIVQHSTVHT